MGRHVITLRPMAVADECAKLEYLIRQSGFVPDLVLSILRGGEYVGRELFRDVRHESVVLQRPTTRRKGRIFGKVMQALPYWLLDRLRIAEAWLLSRKSAKYKPAEVELPDVAALRILIVDDAVDSGHTLRSVVEAVTSANPDADVRTAVITVTTPHPVIRPNYMMFNNLSLIRFPWSKDYKTK